MGARLKIAAAVWIFGLVFGVATAMAVIFALLASIPDFGGHDPARPFGMIAVLVAPAISAAALSKLLAGYSSRVSAGEIHAGPAVVGFAFAFLAVWVSNVDRHFDPGTTLPLSLIATFAGTFAGTFVALPLHPMLAGIAASALSFLAFLIGTGGL